MKRTVRILLGPVAWVVFSLALPGPVSGQGSTWPGISLAQVVDMARWKSGRLRINAALALTETGYVTDIYNGQLEEPVPDYTSFIEMPVQLLLPISKNIILDLYDGPQYMYFRKNEQERGWNNIFRGYLHVPLDRLYFQAGIGLSNVRHRLGPELSIYIRRKEERGNGIFLWQMSRKRSIALLYGMTKYDYGDYEYEGTNLAERLNRKEGFVDLIAYFQSSARVRFYLDGQFGRYKFAYDTASDRNTQSYAVVGGVEFVPRMGELVENMRIIGNANIGYMYFDISDPQYLNGSGLVGDVNISARFGRNWMGRVMFARGFQFSLLAGSSYYASTSYSGSLTRSLSRSVDASYGLTFSTVSYPEDDTGGGLPPTVGGDYTTHAFNLTFQITRDLELTLLSTFTKRVMDMAGTARNRNFFGISLLYGAPSGRLAAPISGLPH